MMSRFMTVEKIAGAFALMLIIALVPQNAWSAEEKEDESPCTLILSGKSVLKGEALTKAMEKCTKNLGGGDACKDEFAKFEKAETDFGASCAKAGETKGSEQGLHCTDVLMSCNESKNEDVSDEEVEEEETPRDSTRPDPLFNIEKKRSEYEVCPVMAKEDFEKFRKEVDEAQEKVDELEKEIPELKDAVGQISTDLTTKLSELAEKKRTAEEEYDTEKKEINRKEKDDKQGLVDQIMQVQEQIDKIESDIRTARMAKIESSMKRDESVKSIKLSCHNAATAEVSARRIELFKKIQAGQVNRGTFGNALKNVGLSDRNADQVLAAHLYRNCLQSAPTTNAIDTANVLLKNLNAQADATILSLQQNLVRQNERINEIRPPGGCTSPASSEKAICRIVIEANEDRTSAAKKAFGVANGIATDVGAAQQNAAQQMQTKQEALALATRRLDREKSYLEDKRKLLALKQDKSGGTSLSAEDFGKLWQNFSELKSAASTLKNGCCSDWRQGDKTPNASTCAKAYKQVNAGQPEGADGVDGALDASATEATAGEGEAEVTPKEIASTLPKAAAKPKAKAKAAPAKKGSPAPVIKATETVKEATPPKRQFGH